MNYRHAFHAGNHTEVFKHAALVFLLEQLRQKPQPFAVLDTHAGLGVYDLRSEEAGRTLEYEQGAARVFGRQTSSAQTYLDLLHAMNPDGLATYPGSPEIVRRLLRDQDRLVACELHPADVEILRRRYRDDRRISVHHRDGYEAIGALLPPPARRGVVFIDPPFERTDEVDRLIEGLETGLRRWPNGIFLAWFPIKDLRIAEALSDAAVAKGFPKALRADFLAYPRDDVSLAGGGVIVCNAPWKLDEKLTAWSRELAGLLGAGDATWAVEQLTPA